DDRFQKDRLGTEERILEGDPRGRLERLLGTVDWVVLAEVNLDRDVLNAIARQRSALQQLATALLDRRYKLVGDRAADDGVEEAEVEIRVVATVVHAELLEALLDGELGEEILLALDALILERINAQMDLAELTASTGLLFVAIIRLAIGRDGLAVGDLWL